MAVKKKAKKKTRKVSTAVAVVAQPMERPMPTVKLGSAPALSRDQVELIKRTVAKGATDDELQLFIHICNRTGLDPFSRQIYFIKRKVKNRSTGNYEEIGTVQTGIDGFRSIAGRTRELAGVEDPIYDTETAPYPQKATVTVYRAVKGQRVPFTATARWKEYAQKDYKTGEAVGLWKNMPYLMLGKCAEALALRKAFPNVLSGVYADEEMDQTNNEMVDAPKMDSYQVAGPMAEERENAIDGVTQQKIDIARHMKTLGYDVMQMERAEANAKIQEITKKKMVEENYEDIIQDLEFLIDEKKAANQK